METLLVSAKDTRPHSPDASPAKKNARTASIEQALKKRGKLPNLNSLSNQELKDLRKEKGLEQIASAHKQARQTVKKAPRSIQAMKKALHSTGAVAGEPKLAAEIRQMGEEINRRRKESERRLARVSPGKLQQMAGEFLAQDFRRLEEKERAMRASDLEREAKAEAEQPKLGEATPLGPLPRAIERGKFYEQVIDESKRIKHLCLGTGRRVAEIQNEHPDFAVWKVRESLGEEDRDAFNHPNQWGAPVGYAKKILAKIHGCSEHTITASVKAYRKFQRKKKWSARF